MSIRVEPTPAERIGVERGRMNRRPSGAPPPLPHKIPASGKLWLAAFVYFIVVVILFSTNSTLMRGFDHAQTWVLLKIAAVRTGWLTSIAHAIKVAGSGWIITALGLSTTALLMIFRRWRHLLVFYGSYFVSALIGVFVLNALARPRPYGVTIIGGWGGYATPSLPVAALTAILLGIAYTLVVPGRPRGYAKIAILAVISLFGLSRLYLAVDHPADILFGIVLGVAGPVTSYRLFTPNEVFPVRYRKGKTAHLDVTGKRGAAIVNAIQDQLGLTVVGIKPVGLESSGGSTPLSLRVAGDPETVLFAKLYAIGHVRADRWYKLWRTILYGSLEDEAPFQTVRRLVEYEDYTLRLLQDVGIPTAAPYGIVEITPEREYMLVTEFFKGAVEVTEAEIDDGLIDSGLKIVRRLWDAGLAHRDIKPANLLVRDGEVLMIDVAFVQVRPSPWRQAVDLANMMLILAVRTDAERVYAHALRYFTPEELAEAFAATRGVASPSQLRMVMKKDGRDLLEHFKRLAPDHPRIKLQRWSMKRLGVAALTFGAILFAVVQGSQSFGPAQDVNVAAPLCGTSTTMILMAQSVPSAAALPCIASLPSGWGFERADINSGSATFWLKSDRAGPGALSVTLSPRCDVTGAQEIPSDGPGTTRFEKPSSLQPRFTGSRFYRFSGGCATYRFSFAPAASSSLVFDANVAVGFVPRATLIEHLRRSEGLTLCGRGAPCLP